jgi:lincosamide nucleotidyltransferase A/C/D/E
VFGVTYEPHHLTGTGTIDSYPVKCIPADVMVEFHGSYELDENDYHDVQALCDKFGFELPEEYQKFIGKEQK